MGASESRAPLDRAIAAAAGLKPGTWESVEALALLAIEARGTASAAALLQSAHAAADGLKAGSWDSVRGLAILARADRELAG